mmetsp:Transcript_25289/g.55282  ORF Transcript_25289/g.55282 Transcript_25289/m.55282 type:complete len:213 (+) Transcript_25289:347-985(+)
MHDFGVEKQSVVMGGSSAVSCADCTLARGDCTSSPTEPLPCAPAVAAKDAPVWLRRARGRPVEQVAQKGGGGEAHVLHVLEKVVDVAREDADEVVDGRAAHEHANREEHPREVKGLHVEEAKDGDDLLSVFPAPEVNNGGEQRLRQKGHVAEHKGDAHLYEPHQHHAPQKVGRAALETLGLKLAAVPHQEEQRKHEGEAKFPEEAEIGNKPP